MWRYRRKLIQQDARLRELLGNPPSHGKSWSGLTEMELGTDFTAGVPVTALANKLGRAVDGVLIKLCRLGYLEEKGVEHFYLRECKVDIEKWPVEARKEWVRVYTREEYLKDTQAPKPRNAMLPEATGIVQGLYIKTEEGENEMQVITNVNVEKRTYINGQNAADLTDDKLIEMLASLKARRKFLMETNEGATNNLMAVALEKVDGQIEDLNEYMNERAGVYPVAVEVTLEGADLKVGSTM